MQQGDAVQQGGAVQQRSAMQQAGVAKDGVAVWLLASTCPSSSSPARHAPALPALPAPRRPAECLYAPFAARGFAREFVKDLEVGRGWAGEGTGGGPSGWAVPERVGPAAARTAGCALCARLEPPNLGRACTCTPAGRPPPRHRGSHPLSRAVSGAGRGRGRRHGRQGDGATAARQLPALRLHLQPGATRQEGLARAGGEAVHCAEHRGRCSPHSICLSPPRCAPPAAGVQGVRAAGGTQQRAAAAGRQPHATSAKTRQRRGSWGSSSSG